MVYRLIAGHNPLDEQEAVAITEAVFCGIALPIDD
jgi:hypothetical protein